MELCTRCDFLERSDRSVKNTGIEERRRKADNKKGPIKCVVRLIERKACHECEKVRGISSGGASMWSHHQGRKPLEASTRNQQGGNHGKAWNGCEFLKRSDRSVKNEAIEERRRKAGKGKARHAGKHTGPGRPYETEYTAKGPKGYFYYSVPIPAGQGWKLT